MVLYYFTHVYICSFLYLPLANFYLLQYNSILLYLYKSACLCYWTIDRYIVSIAKRITCILPAVENDLDGEIVLVVNADVVIRSFNTCLE